MSGLPSRFARVVLQGQTWLNVAYLLLAFPTGLAYFVVLVVGITLGASLAILLIGLAILLATLAAWRAMAALERGLARGLLGVPIAAPADRRGQPPIEQVKGWLRDPVTWKSLVFVALKFPLGVVSFAAVVVLGGFSLILLFSPLIVLDTPVTVFGWIVTSSVQALPLTVAGLIAVPALAAPVQRARLAMGAVRPHHARPEHRGAARARRRPARRARPHHRRR